MKEKGITHVIRVLDMMTLDFPDDFTYKVIQVPDLDYINLIQHFSDTFKFIDDAISNGGKVLVHW